jgi:hypothetical protein
MFSGACASFPCPATTFFSSHWNQLLSELNFNVVWDSVQETFTNFGSISPPKFSFGPGCFPMVLQQSTEAVKTMGKSERLVVPPMLAFEGFLAPHFGHHLSSWAFKSFSVLVYFSALLFIVFVHLYI